MVTEGVITKGVYRTNIFNIYSYTTIMIPHAYGDFVMHLSPSKQKWWIGLIIMSMSLQAKQQEYK